MTGLANKAFEQVKREDFLPAPYRQYADFDEALPIGYGQTNSQPATVAMMLDMLDLQPGQHVLDVGSGSGWTSALLGTMVGPSGKVTAAEIIPELVAWSRQNLSKYDLPQVEVKQARQGLIGWPANAPYDRILVSAAADALPQELVDQLAPGGRMVIPVDIDLLLVTKDSHGGIQQATHPEYKFLFVPLRTE